MELLKNSDPYFRVVLDAAASSPDPAAAVYRAQHTCVSEGFSPDEPVPADPAGAVIRHQFKPGHWSVLNFAFVKLDFQGFPHDTVMQLVRHQGSYPLVQSMRYTGDRMLRLCENYGTVEKVFYCPPVGVYKTRTGSYEITEEHRSVYFKRCFASAQEYRSLVESGIPEELARRSLLSGFRQNFTMAGTVRDVFHWLDQRTLSDTQSEAQLLASMALTELKAWCPEFFDWYILNRAGKNKLAP